VARAIFRDTVYRLTEYLREKAVPGSSRAGALALIVFAVAGATWFALELVQPGAGYADTDSPAVSLAFLRLRPDVYAQAGVALLVMAAALTMGVLSTQAALASRADGLVLRTATAAGSLAAACCFFHGVLRLAIQPLLYIDGLAQGWGESAYLAMQLLGIHTFAQGAIVALAAWAVSVSVLGARTRALPLGLCLLGVLPALRLVGIAGPFISIDGELGGLVWLALMAAIPGSLAWTGLLGVVLLRRAVAIRRGRAVLPATASGAA
jgi:hypothetical protein